MLQAQDNQGDPTPFFEPLLRSFILGLGAGVLFESGTVALRVSDIILASPTNCA